MSSLELNIFIFSSFYLLMAFAFQSDEAHYPCIKGTLVLSNPSAERPVCLSDVFSDGFVARPSSYRSPRPTAKVSLMQKRLPIDLRLINNLKWPHRKLSYFPASPRPLALLPSG